MVIPKTSEDSPELVDLAQWLQDPQHTATALRILAHTKGPHTAATLLRSLQNGRSQKHLGLSKRMWSRHSAHESGLAFVLAGGLRSTHCTMAA